MPPILRRHEEHKNLGKALAKVRRTHWCCRTLCLRVLTVTTKIAQHGVAANASSSTTSEAKYKRESRTQRGVLAHALHLLSPDAKSLSLLSFTTALCREEDDHRRYAIPMLLVPQANSAALNATALTEVMLMSRPAHLAGLASSGSASVCCLLGGPGGGGLTSSREARARPLSTFFRSRAVLLENSFGVFLSVYSFSFSPESTIDSFVDNPPQEHHRAPCARNLPWSRPPEFTC